MKPCKNSELTGFGKSDCKGFSAGFHPAVFACPHGKPSRAFPFAVFLPRYGPWLVASPDTSHGLPHSIAALAPPGAQDGRQRGLSAGLN
jgi:hypothetical protein